MAEIRCTCDQARPSPPYAAPSDHAADCPIRLYAEQLAELTFPDAPVTNSAPVKLRGADAQMRTDDHRCEYRAAAADRKLYADEIYRLLKIEKAVSDRLAAQLTEIETRLETLALEVSDGAFHAQPFDHERLSDLIREVAR